MPNDLKALVAPGHTALVTMELQRGVVGDRASFPALAEAVAKSRLLDNTARLLGAARRAGACVVHCTAGFRPDRAGSYANVPMLGDLMKDPEYLAVGSPDVELVPELDRSPADIESLRLHGMSPFTDTSLDPILRSAGVRVVIATGVSLNVGIPGLVIEAINRGYRVVIARDCVVGSPLEYGEAVLEHSLARLAHIVSGEEIIQAWEESEAP